MRTTTTARAAVSCVAAACAILCAATLPASAQPFGEAYHLVDTWTTRSPSSDVPRLIDPAGLDVGADDVVVVADRGTGDVVRLTSSGRVLDSWTVSDAVSPPRDIAVAADRTLVLGRDAAELRDGDGTLLRTVALPGATGIAAGPDGRFYAPRRILGGGRSDTVITIVGRDGDEQGFIEDDPLVVLSPTGIDVADDGDIYLAADGAIYVFEGGRISRGLRVPHAYEGGDIVDVAVDGQGRVFGLQGGGARRLFAWNGETGDVLAFTSFAGAQAVAAGPGAGLVASVHVVGGFAGLGFLADRADLDTAPVRWGDADMSLGEIVGPRRLATAPSGNVYIVDKRQRVQTWSGDGVPLLQSPAGALTYLNDVAGGAEAPCVAASHTLRCFGTGPTPQWDATPGDERWLAAAAGSGGEIVVVDLIGQAAWVYARDGRLAEAWPLTGDVGYASISDVAVDADLVYLADRSKGRILIRYLDGQPASPGSFDTRGDVERIAAAGGGVFALTRDGWIYKHDSTGRLLTAWLPSRDETPADIAVSPGGRVLVAMTGAEPVGPDEQGRVLLFAPGGTPPDAIPEKPQAGCVVNVDKFAEPQTVLLGDEVEITLLIDGECPYGKGDLDIVLLIDQSGSMTGSPIAAAQSAAISFVGQLDPDEAQVAVVGFSTSAAVLQPLTGDFREVVRAVGRIEAGGQTNYRDALEKALDELTSPGARPGAPPVVVMMTDGKPTDRNLVVRASDDLKGIGATLYTIGLGPNVDAELLRTIASERELFFEAPTEAELADVYAVIARRITASRLLQDAAVSDTLPDYMRYAHDSARPAATLTDRTLTWSLSEVRTTGSVIKYTVRPRRTGLLPTNVAATLDYRDAVGQSGVAVFPVPSVQVLQRTSWSAHLPVAWRSHCRPQRADVVLVFDTSSSMTGPDQPGSAATKLDAALAAGRSFLSAMQLPGDQAAIVTFDSEARRAQGLTGSRPALELAMADIRAGSGTRIDKGLELAVVELLGARHVARNNPVIILLTDGLPEEGTDAHAYDVARDAHRAGISVFTIGLGDDADPDLLWLIAGDDSRAFMAPDAGQLESIYSRIAGQVLCD